MPRVSFATTEPNNMVLDYSVAIYTQTCMHLKSIPLLPHSGLAGKDKLKFQSQAAASLLEVANYIA